MIGGFVITGDVPKQVVLRAIGPSLADAGVIDVLTDPVLELYDSTGTLVAQNDNCSSLPPDRIPPGLTPPSGHESLISVTLSQGSYTGVLRGANGATGVGLFELYDLDPASSRIINISTRGEVGSGSDAMIGGFIIGGDQVTKLIVRAIGPSLAASNIENPLADPRALRQQRLAHFFERQLAVHPKPSKSSTPASRLPTIAKRPSSLLSTRADIPRSCATPPIPKVSRW